MHLEDKTVIITGASKGVGAACARAFAAKGANLMLVARGKRQLEAVAEELRATTRVEYAAMDVTDADACVNLLRKAHYDFGDVHILVNNAGLHMRGPVEHFEAAELGATIDVNLRAPIVLSRLALPYLREAGGGAIINVSSLAGRVPTPSAAAYSASKFGLRAFTFAFGEELRGTGIKLAAVSPGPIDTGYTLEEIDLRTDLTMSQPISTAAEVADEIVALVSDKRREAPMPWLSGLMTNVVYLFPSLGRLALPLLERKGRRVKRALRAKLRAAAREPTE